MDTFIRTVCVCCSTITLVVQFLLSGIATAQGRPTFRADVSQVRVDAEVLSKDGQIIGGLSESDFLIFDEGKQQPLVGFAPEEQSLDIILLFDTSGSMRSKVEKVAAVARQAQHELKGGDRVAIMTFSDQTHLVSPFTRDLDAVERAISGVLGLRFRGLTYIQQAVGDSANYFLQDGPAYRRRSILVITDNMGMRTRNEMSVVHKLWEADVLLCGLTFRDPAYPVRRAIAAVLAPYALAKVGGIDRMAEKTGGEMIPCDKPSSVFPETMRRIRLRYTLYYPTPKGQSGDFRSIRVELSHETRDRYPGARVRARRGYRLSQP